MNSRFNKLLNKILTTSKPSNEVQNEWYIFALPSNLTIFIDRVSKTTLAENMKEAIDVEKRILAVEKKNDVDERKSKRVSLEMILRKKNQKSHSTWKG